MALRIIRKSASQSQVELIKGSGEGAEEGKPLFSLLFLAEEESAVAQIASFIENNVWIQNKAQCLIMKAKSVKTNIRSSFSPIFHTIKLLNDAKESTWSGRLHALLQEAQCEICIFLPSLPPQADLMGMIEAQVKVMQANKTLGILGPALTYEEKIISLGQTWNLNSPEHTLKFATSTKKNVAYKVTPEEGLLYLYNDMPEQVQKQLNQNHVLLAEAVALPFSAIRRSAYLSLKWDKQEWNLPWLAQDLGLSFQKEQYRRGILPLPLHIDAQTKAKLELTPPPENLVEKYPDQPSNRLSGLYKNHGFAQQGTQFTYAKDHREARIRSYIKSKG